MDKALYVAMTGAQANLRAQAAVAHNLANVETTGFKAALATTEAFQVQGPGQPTRAPSMALVGGFDATGGGLVNTGNPLDLALQDGFWLGVQDSAGQEAYTRAADLHVDANGLLANSRGQLVLGEDGAPVAIPPYQALSIGADGTVSVQPLGEPPSTTNQIGRLRLVEVDHRTLGRGEDGLMRLSAGTPPPEQATGEVLFSGTIERSNVDAAGALVQMISLARQFELNINLIKSGDENARAANSLLRAR